MRSLKGFSLVELMVAAAIIGVIAAIAVPSYFSFVTKATRTRATSCLLEHAQYMARYRATNLRYDRDAAGVNISFPTLACASDGGLDTKYTFSFESGFPTISSFKIKAVPTAGDSDCGVLTIDNKGVKTSSGLLSLDSCW